MLTDFQMRILRELAERPNGMDNIESIAPYVAPGYITRPACRGAYCANIRRSAMAMPQYVVRLPARTKNHSSMLAITDAGRALLSGINGDFNSFRQVICGAAGGSFPPHKYSPKPAHTDPFDGNEPDDNLVYLPDDLGVGLRELLAHSDCDGEIGPEMCGKIADELEALLPAIAALTHTPWSGHVERAGGYVEATKKFIAGCRAAHAAGESLEFH